MYRLLILIITYLLVSVHIAQAQEDIVMKIGNHPVCKSEFVKEYNSSNSTSVKEFLPQFVARKIRILDLQDRGIDTLTSFKLLLANYQGKKLRAKYLDNYRQSGIGKEINSRYLDKRWIKYQLIEKYIPQNSSKTLIEKIKLSSDSIYNALKNGADFNALSIVCSGKKKDSIPHWSRVNLLPSEIISLLDNVKAGEILTPVLTPSGYSIIRVDEISEKAPDEIAGKRYEESTESFKEFQCAYDVDNIKSELLYNLAIANDSISYNVNEDAVRNYYNKNKSRYYYDEPRFKGAVIHCSSKKMAKVIKSYLKRYEYGEWHEAIADLTKNEVSPNVKIETGIFKKGDNRFVDKAIFKEENEYIYSSSLPYTFTMGKKLKKKPDSLDDVRDNVMTDIFNERVLLKNHDLIDKYRVEIDNDVLKTVNNDGSN